MMVLVVAILVSIIVIGYIPPANNWNNHQISDIKNDSNYCFSVIGNINGDIYIFNHFLNLSGDSSFVVIDGNFIDEGIIEEYSQFVHNARRYDVPTIFGIGSSESPYGSDLMFKSIFGNPYFSFNTSNSLFIILDNSLGSIDIDQYNWLNKSLSDNAKNKVIIMNNPIINPSESKYETPDGKLLDYLFREKNVTLVISSNEKDFVFEKEGVKYVNLGNDNNVTYTRVCVSGNGIDVSLGHIPRQVDLNLIPTFFIVCKATLLAILIYFSVDILRKEFSR